MRLIGTPAKTRLPKKNDGFGERTAVPGRTSNERADYQDRAGCAREYVVHSGGKVTLDAGLRLAQVAGNDNELVEARRWAARFS